jgi:hypothetical protein
VDYSPRSGACGDLSFFNTASKVRFIHWNHMSDMCFYVVRRVVSTRGNGTLHCKLNDDVYVTWW